MKTPWRVTALDYRYRYRYYIIISRVALLLFLLCYCNEEKYSVDPYRYFRLCCMYLYRYLRYRDKIYILFDCSASS